MLTRSRIPDRNGKGIGSTVPGPGVRLREAVPRPARTRAGSAGVPEVDPAPAQLDGPAAPQLGQLDLAAGVDRDGEEPGVRGVGDPASRVGDARARPGCADGSGARHRGLRTASARSSRASIRARVRRQVAGLQELGQGLGDPARPGRPARRRSPVVASLMATSDAARPAGPGPSRRRPGPAGRRPRSARPDRAAGRSPRPPAGAASRGGSRAARARRTGGGTPRPRARTGSAGSARAIPRVVRSE